MRKIVEPTDDEEAPPPPTEEDAVGLKVIAHRPMPVNE
jgi:hypothetical protein